MIHRTLNHYHLFYLIRAISKNWVLLLPPPLFLLETTATLITGITYWSPLYYYSSNRGQIHWRKEQGFDSGNSNREYMRNVQRSRWSSTSRRIQNHNLHGRFSRTQIEQALVYSPDHYPGFIKTLLCSWPPLARNRYASDITTTIVLPLILQFL